MRSPCRCRVGGCFKVEWDSATSAGRSAFSVYEKLAVRVNTNKGIKRNCYERKEAKAN